ncbi:hypothetical protein V7S43_002211 [Phytophthora oleae]|uniref:Uncharacterized protein n=1 Tax=Phytophthora oleae TaxID=2107226 RepID=A0ABD3G506_9STRA
MGGGREACRAELLGEYSARRVTAADCSAVGVWSSSPSWGWKADLALALVCALCHFLATARLRA